MGKKLGLDKQYSSLLTSVNKNSPSRSYNLGPITEGTPKSPFIKRGLNLTTSVNKVSKLLNVGKKVFGRTPIGKAVGLAIAAGTGANIGYEYGKDKFKSFKEDIKRVTGYKTDKKNKSSSNESYEEGRKEGSKKFKQLKEKVSNTAGQVTGFLTGKRYGGAMKKMNGGMMQGYGAARTSGMGLEDESLPPGQMVRASKGTMAKVKKAALTATALLGANYVGKRSGEKAIIDSINSGQAFKPEGAKMSLFGASLKRSKGGGMDAGAAQNKADFRARVMKLAQRNATEDRITKADIAEATRIIKGRLPSGR
jgi:hypothetical protein